MAIDMLHFEVESLYFDEELDEEIQKCIEYASDHYGEQNAEQSLLRAYFLAPGSSTVLVALYRYYYYQHRLTDALIVAERVLHIYAERLGLPTDWSQLNETQIQMNGDSSMVNLRFYLWTLKGSGYLLLRLGKYELALSRLKKVLELDNNDRLGTKVLIDVTQVEMNRRSFHVVD